MSGNCDKCGRSVSDLLHVQISRQTHSSPAEHEMWCRACCGPELDDFDVAYARAAARYDGEGKDWR